ncbi:hypothetical protein K0M31_003500 [Melipona bicolor]|uniref:Uncharacterized protein n=1 Tax=Melipona bicolor TaxID=60889 RepID=A0AA40KPL0_9HYME|nr:hypothetical protein K0M31_003500 [Melipona bicolor]
MRDAGELGVFTSRRVDSVEMNFSRLATTPKNEEEEEEWQFNLLVAGKTKDTSSNSKTHTPARVESATAIKDTD